jgi:ribosomal-protein-alanine N-acetyltransferase
MMFGFRRPRMLIEGERTFLRPPAFGDHIDWARLRHDSAAFLQAWEPVWAPDHLARSAFNNRVRWAGRMIRAGRGAPLFVFRKTDERLLGAITLDNLRRGPSQTATVGYWIGAPYARQGWMTDALRALRDHAFGAMDLSRLEAACLPENAPSRALLERCGFACEGVARAYLSIDGRWRDHVLHSALRADRIAAGAEHPGPIFGSVGAQAPGSS